jgi:hypothetical protein
MTPAILVRENTAGGIRDALMASVYIASEGKGAAHWTAVLSAFTSLTGQDMDAFGKDTRGYPRLKTAISGAWGTVKSAGYALSSPRRTYHLSTTGAERALQILSQHGIDSEVGVESPEIRAAHEALVGVLHAAVEAAPIEVIEPEGRVGVTWTGPSGTPAANHEIYSDPYFRTLAVEKAKCFGSWSSRASVCAACPLATLCANSMVAAMSAAGAALDAEWETKVANNGTPVVEAQPAPTDAAPATSADLGAFPKDARELEVAFESSCGKCNGIIAEGQTAIHVPGTGIFHPTCNT